mmetsp:Transcript_42755/g.41105  ORF Transcript_42755/g.41105 Transcript_42755/m.41105 type:complete len:166 (-) Transcript_42755:1449-1946(-)
MVLVVTAPVFTTNTFPLFDSPLVDQTVAAGDSDSYTLPSTTDADGDTMTISVNLGSASTFVTYSSGTFSIDPDGGAISNTYTVTVDLTDSYGDTTTETFNIIIEGEDPVVESPATNETESSNSTNSSEASDYYIDTSGGSDSNTDDGSSIPVMVSRMEKPTRPDV